MQLHRVKKAFTPKVVPPLKSWDIFSMHLRQMQNKAKKERDLNILTRFQQKFRWSTDLRRILESQYQALVLTDQNRLIKWVNAGFYDMTGYGITEVRNKSPKMLQGEKTSFQTQERIKEKLHSGHSFSEQITNYRKDGQEYLCQFEIHPLLNHRSELTHFLALENEIK